MKKRSETSFARFPSCSQGGCWYVNKWMIITSSSIIRRQCGIMATMYRGTNARFKSLVPQVSVDWVIIGHTICRHLFLHREQQTRLYYYYWSRPTKKIIYFQTIIIPSFHIWQHIFKIFGRNYFCRLDVFVRRGRVHFLFVPATFFGTIVNATSRCGILVMKHVYSKKNHN
jgi:hypothetical protein